MIASAVFQSLPEDTDEEDVEMEVDPTPAPEKPAEKDTLAVPKPNGSGTETPPPEKAKEPKKFSPPLDASGDLVVECTVYLRLLLLLKAIDAKNIDEVS